MTHTRISVALCFKSIFGVWKRLIEYDLHAFLSTRGVVGGAQRNSGESASWREDGAEIPRIVDVLVAQNSKVTQQIAS